MKITRIDLFHIAILCKPFETSFGTIDVRPALIIKMTGDDSVVGYGESSPLYTPISEPETIADGIRVLQNILPSLLNTEIDESIDIHSLYDAQQYPVSRIGIEAAYLDLCARVRGVSIGTIFGAIRPRIVAGESVGLQSSPEATVSAVRAYVKAGITRVKIKIAPHRDIETIRAVRAVFPSLYLGADANAAYGPHDIELLSELAAFDLGFLEQPFAAHDYESHRLLRTKGIPICLDETVKDLATCRQAIAKSACDMINIKPARIGSFKEVRAIHDYCVSEGIKLFGGGRLETGVGKTMNAAFYALPGFTEPSDITPPQEYLKEDIIHPPFDVRAGTYEIPTSSGTGITVDESILSKFLVERYSYQNE